MTRPEHVRCENCCYYHPKTLDDEPLTRGVCSIGPRSYAKDQDQWCGEFRAEWPEEMRMGPVPFRREDGSLSWRCTVCGDAFSTHDSAQLCFASHSKGDKPSTS